MTKFIVNSTKKFNVIDVKPDHYTILNNIPTFNIKNLVKSKLNIHERFILCKSVAEECIQEDELLKLLEYKDHPICYDGFEPSGRIHIAQGIMRMINVNKLTKAGCHFKFWIADWFAQLNNKIGGDLSKIQTIGKYMIEVWKALGMNMTNVEFLWASEEINKNPNEYWGRVMEIARLNKITRIQRCCTIMGRSETHDMNSAQIFYPCMQCADVFFLKADICQLGMDQRKVNMLAREYCDITTPKIRHKPIILSHHMLGGLKENQIKMSKSDPDSAIFMEDSKEDLARKIKKAYCPPTVIEANPIIDYTKHIIFGFFGKITIKYKDSEHCYENYYTFEEDYKNGIIHPGDLKPAMIDALNIILQPVRDHFSSGEPEKLLNLVKKYIKK